MANDPDDFSDMGASSPATVASAQSPDDFSSLGVPLHATVSPTGYTGTDIPRLLASAGTEALGSTLALPRNLAQGADYVAGLAGYHPGLGSVLGSINAPDGSQLFPDGPTAREMAYQTTGAPEYVPNSASGRYLMSGVENGLLGLASGGLAGVGGLVRGGVDAAVPAAVKGGLSQAAPQAVGGATSEIAGEVMPGHPVAARIAGFLLGSHGASMAGNTVAKSAAMASGLAPQSDLYNAYVRQGVPTTLTGDVTQDPGMMRLQSMAQRMPGGEEQIGHAIGEANDAWQAAAERHASTLGSASTAQEAGQSLQDATNNWLANFKKNSNQAWNTFRTAVPPDTHIGVGGFQQALQDVNGNYGGAQNLAQLLKPGLGQNLQDALNADISPQGTLPWQTVQAVRSRLGEMMESGQPVADTAQSAIKRLYGGLSDDMRAGANQAGPQAAAAFNQANAYTAAGHALIDDHLGKIIQATNPEQATQYALGQMRTGGSRLSAIDFAAPGQAANLGAYVLRQAADKGAQTLPQTLRGISPEAQQRLFSTPSTPLPPQPGGLPQTQFSMGGFVPPKAGNIDPAYQGVQDLRDIGQAMRNTVNRGGNNSNTASHSASGMGRVIMSAELAREGHELAGVPGAVAGAGLGLFAPNAIGAGARMLTANPLLSKIQSTQFAPFSSPNALSLPLALAAASPDRRPAVGQNGQ